jgi:hypothetical protein
MGILSSFFGKKSKQEREMEAIFKKVYDILNNEQVQNERLPEIIRKFMDTRRLDTLPDAVGEFGRDPRNPILCNGPIGELTYLSRLVIPIPDVRKPMRVTFHRLGSLKVNGKMLDEYELISYDGYLHDVLYLDMYHTSKSKICPKGYRLEDECAGLRGMNSCNEDFPYNQYPQVIECAKGMILFPAFDTSLKNMDVKRAAETLYLRWNFLESDFPWWK